MRTEKEIRRYLADLKILERKGVEMDTLLRAIMHLEWVLGADNGVAMAALTLRKDLEELAAQRN